MTEVELSVIRDVLIIFYVTIMIPTTISRVARDNKKDEARNK